MQPIVLSCIELIFGLQLPLLSLQAQLLQAISTLAQDLCPAVVVVTLLNILWLLEPLLEEVALLAAARPRLLQRHVMDTIVPLL